MRKERKALIEDQNSRLPPEWTDSKFSQHSLFMCNRSALFKHSMDIILDTFLANGALGNH